MMSLIRCAPAVVRLLTVLLLFALTSAGLAQQPVIPHAQDKPPNEPRDPETAAKMMTVPEGFSVEVVAAEPDIVNPVAMTIDERGRFWITESLEYPRREPGPGRDRVKVLEDTDGDGRCDKVTVFLEGLNIPSGVAVGHGGVWIANSPDILFVPDADRDAKPDGPAQVVVTGFGRTDTHELPNSLTWGPDGWLYGLNGVFNHSHVKYPDDSPWLKQISNQASGGRQPPDEASDRSGIRGLTPPARPVPTEFKFTCAMFRIHPRTREFQVFAEGTSNPWGIAFNDEGEAFISACVIDHLWHIVETGYYHRQGGPYPPFTWKIDSIVKHKHQKAAYCGIHYFDSDAYPEQYRGKLYMGNIHGGCINVDRVERDGSTYKGFGEPDFLTANDAWFMPVVQKTGPDGCLYILDWYDRYHCYQDANRDPAGIDRLKGRLYRVRYNGDSVAKSTGSVQQGEASKREGEAPAEPRTSTASQPAVKPGSAGASPSRTARIYPLIDLARETDEQLIERLRANNDFIRWTAIRLLQERGAKIELPEDEAEAQNGKLPAFLSVLWETIENPKLPARDRLTALFALQGFRMPWPLSGYVDKNAVEEFKAITPWLHRLAFDNENIRQLMVSKFIQTPWNEYRKGWLKPSEGVDRVALLQEVIGWSKVRHPVALYFLLNGLASCGDDRLIPHIVWQNLHPRLEEQSREFFDALTNGDSLKHKPVLDLMPRVADRILGRQKFEAKPVADLFALLRDDHPLVAGQIIELLSARVQSGELKGDRLEQLKVAMAEPLTPLLADGSIHPLAADAALLAVSWGDPRGLPQVRQTFIKGDLSPDVRLKALHALIAAKDESLLEAITKVFDGLTQRRGNAEEKPPLSASATLRENSAFASQLITALGKLDDPKVADLVLARYAKLEPELQPAVIELLTQRATWSKKLLAQVAEKKIAATAININQARRMQALKDKDLSDLLNRHWGQVRDTRNPDRERVVAEMKALIRSSKGDAFAGEKVFKRVCAACHKIYGEGPEIGPDITSNGRNDFNQLLSNVFDPSLVIGAGYRVCTVITTSGRVQSGLLVEDSPQRVVLKPAAVGRPRDGSDSPPADGAVTVSVGALITIPRDEIDELTLSELSLMPEGLEKQLTRQEIADLFAFLTLDKHPADQSAKRLPGVTAVTPRDSTNPAEFPALVAEILPGFTCSESGELGIGLLQEHFGRENVLRTHPVSRDKPCVLTQTLTPPAGKKTTLVLDVAHDPRGDWRLVVRGNGQRMADEMISRETCQNGWRTIEVDLTKFAGQPLKLDLVNQANDWSWEFGYWGAARVTTE